MPINMDKHFFVIDSDNLNEVGDSLYGFFITEQGIYTEKICYDMGWSNVPEPDGNGVYVLIRRERETITIKQDFNGSYQLCIYRHRDYFAISNSVQCLVDYLKGRYPLTLDRKYAMHYLSTKLMPYTVDEALYKEIRKIRRTQEVHIGIAKKDVSFEEIDYQEESLRLDSAEGMACVDSWVKKWAIIFRQIAEKNDHFIIQLSGGFDSRMVFVPVLFSGLNLGNVRVESRIGNVYSYQEDYQIASRIAEEYGFKLNDERARQGRMICLSSEEKYHLKKYCKFPFHNEAACSTGIFEDIRYRVTGYGGECVRGYWDFDIRHLIEHAWSEIPADYPVRLKEEIEAIEKEHILSGEAKILGDATDTLSEADLYGKRAMDMLKETLNREHFGTDDTICWMSNIVDISPLIDPQIRKIRISTDEIRDDNLLMAVLLQRYCPELLGFPFTGGRKIRKDLVSIAEKINKWFPKADEEINYGDIAKQKFHIQDMDESFPLDARSGRCCTVEETESYQFRLLCQKEVKDMFCKEFPEEIYAEAVKYFDTTNYWPMARGNAVLAVCDAIKMTTKS